MNLRKKIDHNASSFRHKIIWNFGVKLLVQPKIEDFKIGPPIISLNNSEKLRIINCVFFGLFDKIYLNFFNEKKNTPFKKRRIFP